MSKVIHLVVGTFEQGLETSPVECPPIECGQSDGATGALYKKDRVLQIAPDAGHIVTGRWVQRPVSDSSEQRSRSCDRTLV